MRKQYTLKDMPEFQDRLNEQVLIWLEEMSRPTDEPEDEAWNAKVSLLIGAWREGEGQFSAEVGRHIEAICDAVREALQ